MKFFVPLKYMTAVTAYSIFAFDIITNKNKTYPLLKLPSFYLNTMAVVLITISFYLTNIFNACEDGDILYVLYYVKKNSDINVKNFWGETPLHIACKHNRQFMARLLIKYGANVNIKDNTRARHTPLDHAINNKNPYLINLINSKMSKSHTDNTNDTH